MRQNGVVLDGPDFTMGDMADALMDREDHDCCDSEFNGYGCTRVRGHRGAHAAATTRDDVAAIWE